MPYSWGMSLTPEQLALLQSEAGLVDSHDITSDSERTRMRSASDLKDLQTLIGNSSGCQSRPSVFRSMFMFRGRSDQYKDR